MSDAVSGVNLVRIGKLGKILTARFYNQEYLFPIAEIQYALFQKKAINHSIKYPVMHRIIQMPVNIIIIPPRSYLCKALIIEA